MPETRTFIQNKATSGESIGQGEYKIMGAWMELLKVISPDAAYHMNEAKHSFAESKRYFKEAFSSSEQEKKEKIVKAHMNGNPSNSMNRNLYFTNNEEPTHNKVAPIQAEEFMPMANLVTKEEGNMCCKYCLSKLERGQMYCPNCGGLAEELFLREECGTIASITSINQDYKDGMRDYNIGNYDNDDEDYDDEEYDDEEDDDEEYDDEEYDDDGDFDDEDGDFDDEDGDFDDEDGEDDKEIYNSNEADKEDGSVGGIKGLVDVDFSIIENLLIVTFPIFGIIALLVGNQTEKKRKTIKTCTWIGVILWCVIFAG